MTVVGFEVDFRRVLADGKSWGDVGAYEELRGTLRFAIDPQNDANSRITDVEFAPRNENGLVEFSSDVSIIVPVDHSRGSGKMILDVVNRGNRIALPNFNRSERLFIDENVPVDAPIDLGDGFLMKRGYTVVACGWQVDAPDHPALITMRGQDAHNSAGSQLTGGIYMQLQSATDTKNFLLSDKNHKAYEAFDMEESGAFMEVRDMPDGAASPVPRDFWRFGKIDDSGNYEPDAGYICSEQGFEKGKLYQIVYTTRWSPILGLSFAALRDCVTWMKHGSDSTPSPIDGIRHAFAYGRSQTGRYLRTYIYNDFNVDEQGNEALDGVIANVAGGMRGEFNQRFGQNSKDRNNMLTQMFPFAGAPQTDLEIEETDSLHRRLDERGSSLKAMYTNSSAEYHRGDASLIHTDPDGTRDIDIGQNARVYHFTGTEHGMGVWPPTDSANSGEGENRSQNIRGVIDYSPLLRACLVNLEKWVESGAAPPPSKHPRLDDGSALPPEVLSKVFDKIPGANYPKRHAVPRRRDYGLRESHEQTTTLPPRIGKPFGTVVSSVDSDGNEIAGVKLPEVAVPLATHTGWTLRHADIGGETQLLMFAGGTIPFARDEASRLTNGDPRPSIAKRYSSKEDYLERVKQAADELVRQRYLLEGDIELCLNQAAKLWDWFAA